MNSAIPHSRPSMGEEEANAALRVLRSGRVAQGKEVQGFEREVAEFVGRGHGVAVSSGTAALHLALLALELEAGSRVLAPSYVCTALLHAIRMADARPALCDVDLETGNLDPRDADARWRGKFQAAILPHMFGMPGCIDELSSLGVPLVEDLAMSIGAFGRIPSGGGDVSSVSAKGVRLGCFGRLSICSFYATKLLTSGGEGGMVLTDSPELAEKMMRLREYDGLPAGRLRYNYKMTDLAAAVGRVQLQKLSEHIERRRQIAAIYDAAFDRLPVGLPPKDERRIYFRYVLRTRRPVGEIASQLASHGITARKPVDRPLHRELGAADSDYPNTSKAHEFDMSIPLYPSQTEAEIARVVSAIESVVGA